MRRMAPIIRLVGLAAALTAGCATTESTTEDSTDASREAPPEVTDHTVDDRSESTRSVRPRVDVRIDSEELVGVESGDYEASVRRGAQQCYSRSIQSRDSKAEGAVVYEVIVTRNGYVAGSDIMSTGLRDDGVESCVEHVISRLRFDIPVQNRPVYRLFFRFDFYLETLVPSEPPV